MKLILSLCLLFTTMALTAEDDKSLKLALDSFLLGASINDADVHENFWAEELVYTSSSGTRFGKQQLMQGVNSGKKVSLEKATTLYSAEAVNITSVDEVKVLTFTLVATNAQTKTITQKYLNTGIMVWRDKRWQAVNWQATRMASETVTD